MKNRLIAAIGFLLTDFGIFVAVCAYLPKLNNWVSYGHWGPLSRFISSRKHWDVAWGVLIASIVISAGVFLIMESLGAFKDKA
jgi:hypothetical protein